MQGATCLHAGRRKSRARSALNQALSARGSQVAPVELFCHTKPQSPAELGPAAVEQASARTCERVRRLHTEQPQVSSSHCSQLGCLSLECTTTQATTRACCCPSFITLHQLHVMPRLRSSSSGLSGRSPSPVSIGSRPSVAAAAGFWWTTVCLMFTSPSDVGNA